VQGLYQNITASLRDLYGTFTTSFPLFVMLHSIKADGTGSSEPVTVIAPGATTGCLVKRRVQIACEAYLSMRQAGTQEHKEEHSMEQPAQYDHIGSKRLSGNLFALLQRDQAAF
jgi:hypothetical protein